MTKDENKALNIQDWLDGKTRLETYPVEWTIGITRRCNYACRMCYRHQYGAEHNRMELGQSALEKLRPYLEYATTCRWHCDGEIFAASNFAGMFELVRDCRAEINGFSTNGYELVHHVDEIVNSNISLINVSLDAATETTYASIRKGGGAFGRVLEGIRQIIAHRSQKPEMELMFIVMKPNISEMEDFIRLASDVGADRVFFQRFNPNVVGKDIRHWRVEKQEEAVAFGKARTLGKALNIPVRHTCEDELNDMLGDPGEVIRCSLPWRGFLVEVDGNVKCCCFQKKPLGNLNQHTFEDIWNGKAFQSLRKAVHEEHYDKFCLPECPHVSPQKKPGLKTYWQSFKKSIISR
ncbi:MAG: SPASM domain-containing protein [Syntrophaceae bacterium]|jgi:MoaA/NifB/PqqE/SkfB family radical SAM enzyme|nr:SPASM domain-containing protein [Syntrophaceae bacterium]